MKCSYFEVLFYVLLTWVSENDERQLLLSGPIG
jgi:hypothetical protein